MVGGQWSNSCVTAEAPRRHHTSSHAKLRLPRNKPIRFIQALDGSILIVNWLLALAVIVNIFSFRAALNIFSI